MSASEGCSKEGSTSDGYPCRYACCPARTAREAELAAATLPLLRNRGGGAVGVRDQAYTPEDRCYYKDSSDDQDRKLIGDKGGGGGGGGNGHSLQKALSTTTATTTTPGSSAGGGRLADDSPHADWKPEKDLKKWREIEAACHNGAEVWRERGDKRERILVSAAACLEPTTSPPPPPVRRSMRSETPDDDSVSFHETLGRELR
jgi:hypothetical protein